MNHIVKGVGCKWAFLCLLLLLASCSEEKKKKLGNSKGQPSEVLVVVDDNLAKSDLEKTIKEELLSKVPGIMQGEPFFDALSITTSMDERDFRLEHSRVEVHIDKTLKEATHEVKKNVYAIPQCQIELSGPSASAVREYMSAHAEQIRQTLLDAQLRNQSALLKKKYSKKLQEDVKSVLGYTVYAPEELQFTKKANRFVWSSSSADSDRQINMVFYSLPYNGEDIHDAVWLVEKRDSVMKVNLPGGREDQWMETVWSDGKPMAQAKTRNLNGREVTELRGMWQMRNDAMGGPFVSVCFVDSASQQVVVGEGFVFAPSTPKRDLLRSLEASLRTLKK